MSINAAADPHIYTDNSGLASLKAAARSGEHSEETLRKVAGQFESIMINQMMKVMRETTFGDDLMGSDQTKFYQSMFDQQISQEITRGRGLGLAELLVRQLSPESQQATEKPTGNAPMALDNSQRLSYAVQRPSRQAASATSSASPVSRAKPEQAVDLLRNWQPASPKEFVKELWPHAQKAAEQLGTEPEVIVAQAALESGWGQHQMRFRNGRSAHNLFGIKADDRWQGQRISHQTLEFRSGVMQQERAAFRAYSSAADSVQDYVSFIKGNPRYQQALNANQTGRDYIHEIHQAGYATDPEYKMKINKIMNSSQFESALSELKSGATQPLNSIAESTAGEHLVPNHAAATTRSGEV